MIHMTVKVYSTPTCPYCIMAKKFLDENNIQYENLDVSSDRQAADEMIKKSGQRGVPVLDIDGQVIVGFDKGKIESLIFKN
jgi:glutaredoxin 3